MKSGMFVIHNSRYVIPGATASGILFFNDPLYDKVHIFQFSFVFRSAGDDIDPCRIDACMTKDVGKFCDIFFHFIESAGE